MAARIGDDDARQLKISICSLLEQIPLLEQIRTLLPNGPTEYWFFKVKRCYVDRAPINDYVT